MNSSDGGMGRAAKGAYFPKDHFFVLLFFFHSYFRSLITKIRF